MSLHTFAALAVSITAAIATGQVRITEYMYTGNSDEFTELTNVGTSAVDLTGWSMDDSHRTAGFIPIGALGTMLPGESVILTPATAAVFRTNWALPTTVKVLGGTGTGGHDLGRGDEINIYNSTGSLVDRLTYNDQTIAGSPRANAISAWAPTNAIGVNNSALWRLSALGDIQVSWTATSGDVGSPGTHTLGSAPVVTSPPVFSQASGYYEDAFDLTIVPQAAGGDVHYTLDGTTPTAASPLLMTSINIHSRVGEPNVLSQIQTCPSEYWVPPTSEIFKIVTVRAIAIRQGALPSSTVTRTFLVGHGVGNRYSFPVISIVTDPDNLFGFVNGLYVPGKIYQDNYDINIPPELRIANYTQDGSTWERPAFMQFFETDHSLAFEQGIGLRINGGTSRTFEQKSLRLVADSQYGTNAITYPIFQDPAVPTTQKRLILRNAGNDNAEAFCRDDLMQSLVTDTGVDTQASRFAIVFVDGEYWGIHSIRERYDKYYMQYHHGADPDNIDYLEGFGLLPTAVKEGDRVHYAAMLDFMHGADLTDDANIAQLETYMDMDNFLTYMGEEIYSANYDWPVNNDEYWRPRTATGRWQWLLKDTDLGFNFGGLSTPSTDSIVRLLHDTSWATDIFRSILVNQHVKERFINRLADLLNTSFVPDRVLGRVEEYRTMLAPNMPEHVTRWHQPYAYAYWNAQMDAMADFAAHRPGFVRQHVVNNFSLEGTSTVTVACDNTDGGTVTLSTLNLSQRGMPFTGTYFKGIPVTIHTDLAPGYCSASFDGAPSTATYVGSTDVTFDPQEDATVSIHFIRSVDYNEDGGIDGSDVNAFFDRWEAGDAAADVNGDGGVDGPDIAAFFALWEQGAC